jgi:hypothetical protein
VIVGGPGADRIRAGLRNDRIDVRDGETDVVSCGKGNDRVAADPGDTVRGCERVKTT